MLSKRIQMDDFSCNKSNNNGNEIKEDKRSQLKNAQKDKFQLARRNTIKTLLIVACCFIVCWSQDQIFYFMFYCGYPIDWNSHYYHIIGLMVFLNSTINPFVYIVMYRDYQIALKTLLGCNKKERQEDRSLNSLQTSFTIA